MNSLGENEFCETNVKEGAKRTNDSLSFLFGMALIRDKIGAELCDIKNNNIRQFFALPDS